MGAKGNIRRTLQKLLCPYRVSGHSMYPVLKDGDYVIASSLLPLKVGKIVVIDHPQLNTIIKRITEINAQGLRVKGESAESTSSDKIGIVSKKDVLGVVIAHVPS